MVLELQGTERVGNALDGILQAQGPVVHGVDAPGVALTVMMNVEDAVDHGVAHIQVGRGYVDFCFEGP